MPVIIHTLIERLSSSSWVRIYNTSWRRAKRTSRVKVIHLDNGWE